MTLEELLNFFNFKDFVTKSMDYVKTIRQRINLEEEWILFSNELSKLKLTELSVPEKLSLAKLALSCLREDHDIAPGELLQLIKALIRLKHSFGSSVYYSLLTAKLPLGERFIKDYLMLCHLAEELKEDAACGLELLNFHKLDGTEFPLKKMLDKFHHKQREDFLKKHPVTPLDKLLAAFRIKDGAIIATEAVLDSGAAAGAGASVAATTGAGARPRPRPRAKPEAAADAASKTADSNFLLNEMELIGLAAEFGEIDSKKEGLIKLSLDQLCAAIKYHADILKEYPKLQSARVELLAFLRELIRRYFKIFPHDIQMMALLAMIRQPESLELRGRIAQIKTGEGKSTIIAMLSAFMALQGRFVDVITSNQYLAIRDRIKYQGFFKLIGITVSDICKLHPDKKDFEGQIIYGTAENHKFSIMRDRLYGLKLRYSFQEGKLEPRTTDGMITDEIDSLVVDAALNSAQIAVPSLEDHRWVYQDIYDFVKLKMPEPLAKKENISIEVVRELREDVLKKLHSGLYAEKVEAFSDDALRIWIFSANNALNMKEDTDYVIQMLPISINGVYQSTPKVVIVDYRNTGRMKEGSRWQDGLHAFVEIKHKIAPEVEFYTAASLSHPSFFGSYKTIYGLTGTLGEQFIRDEVLKTYKINAFEVPQRIRSKREFLGLILHDSLEAQCEAIYLALMERASVNKQAVLVLFNTIQETTDFSRFLTEKTLSHQILNERQSETEDSVIALAAEPGVITIATNVAGRGTDFSAEDMHVIFASFPENERVENQGFGRTARQGRKGSCELILSIVDPGLAIVRGGQLQLRLLRNTFEKISKTKFYEVLCESRMLNAEDQLKARGVRMSIEQLYFKKQQKFFDKMDEIHFDFDRLSREFVRQCESFRASTELSSDFVLSDNWLSIILHARVLLQHRVSSTRINWEAFVSAYKEIFIEEFRTAWAKLYTDFQRCCDLDTAESYIDSKYSAFENAWVAYFKFEKLLNYILTRASTVSVEAAPLSAAVEATEAHALLSLRV